MFLKIFKAGDSGDILVSASYENGCIYFWNVKTATLMFHARLDSDPGITGLLLAERNDKLGGTKEGERERNRERGGERVERKKAKERRERRKE